MWLQTVVLLMSTVWMPIVDAARTAMMHLTESWAGRWMEQPRRGLAYTLRRLEAAQAGQSMVEYAVVVAAVALVALVAVQLLGTRVTAIFQDLTRSMQTLSGR